MVEAVTRRPAERPTCSPRRLQRGTHDRPRRQGREGRRRGDGQGLEDYTFEGPKGALTVRAGDHALIQDMYQVKLVANGGSFTPALVDTVPAEQVAPAKK
jgi:hypothetical protein